ncbi:MAG: hypothetical protein KC777_00945 [Cyanobacteria bacterium HKST-UBA02]|nr:hypothetical protein [Cyanobacteria bacterium HKST-UBA02]
MFNIELEGFSPSERREAQFMLGAFNMLEEMNMGFFKKAWTGWPEDGSAPRDGRTDKEIQNVLDMTLAYGFGDLYGKPR